MFDYPIMGDKLDLCNNRFTQTILQSLTTVRKLNPPVYFPFVVFLLLDHEYDILKLECLFASG